MTRGYNKPDSAVWHQEQRCSGALFPPMAELSMTAAQTRGLRPCTVCCPDGWPDDE